VLLGLLPAKVLRDRLLQQPSSRAQFKEPRLRPLQIGHPSQKWLHQRHQLPHRRNRLCRGSTNCLRPLNWRPPQSLKPPPHCRNQTNSPQPPHCKNLLSSSVPPTLPKAAELPAPPILPRAPSIPIGVRVISRPLLPPAVTLPAPPTLASQEPSPTHLTWPSLLPWHRHLRLSSDLPSQHRRILFKPHHLASVRAILSKTKKREEKLLRAYRETVYC
jgi:hypothetical protein